MSGVHAMPRLTDHQRARIEAEYLDGESSGRLGRRYGVTDRTIIATLQKRGVPRRGPSEARRGYQLREDAFSVLTPEAAYWAGFLMADGCVTGDRIQLRLAARDRGHVLACRRFLAARVALHRHDETRSVYIAVRSRRLSFALGRLGVTPRKSRTAVASDRLVDRPEFWLGVFDGDGSICTTHGMALVTLCSGSERLMQQYADFLSRHVTGRSRMKRPSVQRTRSELYVVTVYGRRAARLLDLFYATSPVRLARKHAKMLRIRKETRSWVSTTGT